MPVVYVDDEPAPGTWGTSGNRDRTGKASISNFFGPLQTTRRHSAEDLGTQTNRILSDSELWEIYLRCGDVRAPIDAISRRVSTWDWVFEPTVDPASEQYEAAEQEALEATSFFSTPNEDGEPIQVLLDKFTKDLLIYDHGVWELVYDCNLVVDELGRPTGDLTLGENLKEVVALRGSDIYPVMDEYGRVLGYVQKSSVDGNSLVVPRKEAGEFKPDFEKKQILAQQLASNTSNERAPLIETVVTEIIALCLSSQHAMRAFNSEIPPGILVLMGIVGKAAADAKRDLKQQRGRGDHLHVLTVADPASKGAHWVELQHTAKDVDFVNVVREIRRAIWRIFGVLPVEMGATEDIPRAVGAVQLEVSTSHLIGPILEILEQRINTQLVPVLPGGDKGRIRFRFDRETKLTPDEQKAKASMLINLVKEGLLTRNEARDELGKAPYGDVGDVATVTTSTGPAPLSSFVAALNVDDDDDDDDPSGGGGGSSSGDEVQDPDAETETEKGSPAEEGRSLEARGDLPSSWPKAGMFSNSRTIDLTALGDIVSEYTREVTPIYEEAQNEILAATRSIYVEGSFGAEEAGILLDRISKSIDKLDAKWALGTAQHYQRTAKLGRDAATQFSGQPVVDDWRERGGQYHSLAMGYLTTNGGLTDTLRSQMITIINAAVEADRRAVELDGTSKSLLGAISATWDSAKHRIKNWAGRLVELANETLVLGMQQASTYVDPVEGLRATEWFVEWVSVQDKATCPTCEQESLGGIRSASSLSTTPGGATECRAKCRCVLVWWTREEVRNGTAVGLN